MNSETPAMRQSIHSFSAALLLAAIAPPALAQWRAHPELPAWCRRGKVRWVHGFAKMDLARVNMLLDIGFNLKQSGRFDSDAAARRARRGGLRFQPYICSKTIFWQRLFKTHPELKNACCLDPAGKRRLMYGNPKRYAGCYRTPAWRAYIEERIQKTIQTTQPDSIFFDNFNCYDCYCPLCRKQFPAFTRKLFGKSMTLDHPRNTPRFRFAKLLFDAEAARDFFRQMRACIRRCSRKPVMVCPNCHVSVNWHAYLTALGVNDMVFYEEGHEFPPFTRQIYGYKLGLALSQGKVVGQLLGLPPAVAQQRALKWGKDWQFHKPEVQESFTYPQEYQLAIAEAAACDGTFIPSTSIREQKIRPTHDPHQIAVRAAMKKYYRFLIRHEALYAEALPGASTAVLYSIWTNLHDRKAQRLRRVTADLIRAGRPFEIITENDLVPAVLRNYRTLIVCQVRWLDPGDRRAIADFAAQGGRVLLVGRCAVAARLGRPYPTPPTHKFWSARQPQLQVGRGRAAWIPEWPTGKSAQEMRRFLDQSLGPAPVSIDPSETLALNLLRSSDGKQLEAHLLNYDFRYRRPTEGNEIADDSGLASARTYLADTHWRARKILIVPHPERLEKPVLRFFGRSPGTDRFTLIVSVNGRDLAALPGSTLSRQAWYEVALSHALKPGKNIVEFRVAGKPNSNPDYFNLAIDTRARTHRSLWSFDAGKTFTAADLSPDRGAQTGEYLVRIIDKAHFRTTFTPADFQGRLTIRPAQNLALTVPLAFRRRRALCLSPDHPPLVLPAPRVLEDRCVFHIPSLSIYTVVVFQ